MMDEMSSLRGRLSVHRKNEAETHDPRFVEARQKAQLDPALGEWWAAEQEQDRMISAKLASVPVPAGLKARLLSPQKSFVAPRPGWTRAALLAAACLVGLAIIFGSWRGPFQPEVSLADYRDEMVGFIKVDPNLEMKSIELAQVTNWLQKKHTVSQLTLPKKLQDLEPIGCRTLRFRGHDVALICFKRKEGGLLHVFVVNGAALPKAMKNSERQISPEGTWMTAAWSQGDQIYLMTAQGDREAIESYLADS